MKKQVLKALSLASLAFALMVGSVSASGIGERVDVKIPFAFAVGKQTLPAGVYNVRALSPTVLSIQSADHKLTATVFIIDKQARQTPEQTKLAFRRYGDQYFFAQFWTAGNDRGYEVLPSRAERELIKDSSKHLAQKAAEPELIYVAAD